MPRRRPHPGGLTGGRHCHRHGTLRRNLLVTEAYTGHVLDRLITAAGLGLLATLASAQVAVHDEATEQAHDDVVVGYHRLLPLVRHARYDIVHVGGASLGLAAMIVVELVSTVALIALLIGWAERRTARRAPGASPNSGTNTANGSLTAIRKPDATHHRWTLRPTPSGVDSDRTHRVVPGDPGQYSGEATQGPTKTVS